MNFLLQTIMKNHKFNEIVHKIEETQSPIALSGLSDVSKLQMIMALQENQKKSTCIVTYNEIQAKKIIEDLKYYGAKVLYFPKREIASYDYLVESKDLPYERIHVLNEIKLIEQKRRNANIVIVTTIEAIMQKMISKNELYENIIEFKVGNSYNLEKIKQALILLGYERQELIENKGQFSIRGDIIDIGLSEKIGVRIELWGDEVDSIRYFHIASQRSTEMLDEITIFPAHEFVVKDIENVCRRLENLEYNISEDIELIKNGEYLSKIDKYFNQFYQNQQYFLDYIPNNFLVFLDENSKIEPRKQNLIIDNNHLIENLIEKERFVPEAIKNISNFEYDFSQKQIIYLEQNDIIKNIEKFFFETRDIHFHQAELEMFAEDLRKYQKEKKKVLLLAGNETNAKKVCEFLQEKQLTYQFKDIINEIEDGNIVVSLGGFSNGFANYDLNLVVISMQEGSGEAAKKKRVTSQFKQAEKIVYADLKNGDFVVHKSHGIGEFIGVNTITTEGVTKDYIKIKYKNDDILYVPTTDLDSVRKYVGGGDGIPKINKLGSNILVNFFKLHTPPY